MKEKREISRDLTHAREHLERSRDETNFAINVLNKIIARETKARRITDEPMKKINEKMGGDNE